MPNHTEAYLNGWFAHKIAHKIDRAVNNPYDEHTQEFSCLQWNTGYEARQQAVKHDLDLSLDEMDAFSC